MAAPSTNQTTKSEKERPLTPAEAHTKILAQFRVADTVARLDGWAKWGKDSFDFAPAQEEEQSEAYHDALERINRANGLRKGHIDFNTIAAVYLPIEPPRERSHVLGRQNDEFVPKEVFLPLAIPCGGQGSVNDLPETILIHGLLLRPNDKLNSGGRCKP